MVGVSQAAQVFMGTQERKEERKEESMYVDAFCGCAMADNIGHMADNTFWFRWIHGAL